jgi:hypothetical protein
MPTEEAMELQPTCSFVSGQLRSPTSPILGGTGEE